MQETQEMQVQSLGQEDPLEEEMTTHSSILAGRMPWTEEPGRLQSTGSQGVRHDEHMTQFIYKYNRQNCTSFFLLLLLLLSRFGRVWLL